MEHKLRYQNPAVNSVRIYLMIGLWVLFVLSITTIAWGAFAPIDSAVMARGSITMLTNKKTIQHLEGGIIEKLFVKDGDTVKKDEPLILLNNTESSANRNLVKGKLFEEKATQARFIAMRDKQESVIFDKDILDGANNDQSLADIIQTQTNLFNDSVSAQESKLAALEKKIAQFQEQIKGFNIQKTSSQESLNLQREQVINIKKLFKKGYATRTQMVKLQQDEQTLEGNVGQYDAQIAQAQQGIIETQMAVKNQESEYSLAISDGLSVAQSKISDLSDKLRAAEDIDSRTTITSPTEGIVNGLKFHTVGGVIRGGEPIMDIIPQDDQLIVDAHIKPSDIDVVGSGEDVKVIFSAYKTRTTPKVPGKVIQVSADRLIDTGVMPPESYYQASIEVDKNFLHNMNEKVELYPGMPVDVIIRTGSRSFLGYMFAPITTSMQKAFREE